MNTSDIKLIKDLLEKVKDFDNGCGCCSDITSSETLEYKALESRILELEESNPPADLPPSGGQVEHVVGRTNLNPEQ